MPTNMDPIMATDRGFCISDPISEVNSSGTIAKMVVSEVMMIALNLRLPAVCMASTRGTPAFRSSLIASSVKIESFNTTRHDNTYGGHQVQRMAENP